MSVTYQQFLDSAKESLNGESEIDYRNAASRSYYAAYHICLDLGRRFPDFTDVKGGVHERLINKLVNAKDPNIKSVGYILQTCRSFRKKADYLLQDKFSKYEAETTIKQTEKIANNRQKISQVI